VLTEKPRLLQHYHARYSSVCNQHDIIQRIDQVPVWEAEYSGSQHMLDEIFDYWITLCATQFLIYVWKQILGNSSSNSAVLPHFREDARHGQLPLCHSVLEEVIADEEQVECSVLGVASPARRFTGLVC